MLVREIDAHRVVSRVIPILVEWAVFSASPPTLGSMGLVPGGGGMVLGAQICLPPLSRAFTQSACKGYHPSVGGWLPVACSLLCLI
jgi:hypothetical protein